MVVPNTVAANAAVKVNAKEGSGIIGLVLYAGLQALLEQKVMHSALNIARRNQVVQKL